MKNVLMIIALMTCFGIHSQWVYGEIFNGLGKPSLKRAYNLIDNNEYLSLEINDTTTKPLIGLGNFYFCGDKIFIDFILVVKGVNKLYKVNLIKARNNKKYYINNSIWTNEFIADFKLASKCLIKINQEYCIDQDYTFNFSKSAAAYNYMIK